MRYDGKYVSWYGFYHCSIWTEESKYQLQLSCFTLIESAFPFMSCI